MPKAVLLLPKPNHSVNLLAEFQEFRVKGQFVDLSLVCGDGARVPCHSLVLGTSNAFWRGVLKSLHGLGFHGVDGSPIHVLMPELKGDEVEEFVKSLYQTDRYQNCRTDPEKIFLLGTAEEGAHRPEDDYLDLNILEPKTVVRESVDAFEEEVGAETRYEYDTETYSGQKTEPMEDDEEEFDNPRDGKEFVDEDEENENDEEDDDSKEEVVLPENCCQPPVYNGNSDAIFCSAGEPDNMMILLQKGERDSEVIHQAIHCLCHAVGFDFGRFYRKVMDEAHSFHRPSQQITSNSVLCSEERKQIKMTYLKKMRAIRKEGGDISAPPPIDEAKYAECFSGKSVVRRRPWFKSYRTTTETLPVSCKVGKTARKVKSLCVENLELKNVQQVGKLEFAHDQLRLREKLTINWAKSQDQSAGGITLARTGKQFHQVMEIVYKMVTELVSLETLQMALKICPIVAKTLAVEKNKIESQIAAECLFEYTCSVCNAVFSRLDKNKYQLHKKDHDPTCNVCGLKFPTGIMLEQHKNATHRPQRKFKCAEGSCNYRASSQKALDNHVMKNHREFVACSKCGDIQRSGVIKYHEKHCGVKKPCPVCNRLYSSQHLKAHLQTAHNNDSGNCYPCDTCGKTFSNRANLGRHVDRIHRLDCDKNYVCKTCGRGFMTLDAMESHETVHTGEKPKGCRYCDKRYKSSSTTRHHERTKHPELYQHRPRKKKVGMEKYQAPALKIKYEGDTMSQKSTGNGISETQLENHQALRPEAITPVLSTAPSTPVPASHTQLSQPTQQMHPHLQQLQQNHQNVPQSQGFPHPLSLHLPFGTTHHAHQGHQLHLPPHMQH